MSALNGLPIQKFSQLIESLVNEMTGYICESWQNLTCDLEWSEQESKNIKEEITKIIVEIIYYTDSQRLNILSNIFDNDKADFLANYIPSRKLHIAKALLKQHNASVKPVLNDFDWKAKWILGNSSSTVIKYPIVNLRLYNLCHGDDESENISFELKKDELNNLINLLEQHGQS